MSLTKLLVVPKKIFQKEVIAFLIVRRFDLGYNTDQILYLNIRPTSSVSTLRYKVWHLLELPDYCDEIIVLKTSDNVEIPLITLRKGNQPNRPYILEVWPAPKMLSCSTATIHNNMLTMGREDAFSTTSECFLDDEVDNTKSLIALNDSKATYPATTATELPPPPPLRQLHCLDNSGLMTSDSKKSVGSCISNKSSIFKLQDKRSKENFTNIILKIQSDLLTLSNKLSTLETRIPS